MPVQVSLHLTGRRLQIKNNVKALNNLLTGMVAQEVFLRSPSAYLKESGDSKVCTRARVSSLKRVAFKKGACLKRCTREVLFTETVPEFPLVGTIAKDWFGQKVYVCLSFAACCVFR